ncbi:MAG TPA: glycosyltransferase, partial [Bacteroidia bacterium]|nr:glycosyltransferase [Bacteroidia bacterium]
DQRVHRSALTLSELGHRVTLIGRKMSRSPEVEERPYKIKRFHLWFEKGPLFYATYNLRLFIYLLFHRSDLLFANDLDTLAANRMVKFLKGIPLVYDSHEYFTGVPELENRPFVQSIWKKIEKACIKGVDRMITVNRSIADLYHREYQLDVEVVRNVPLGAVYADETIDKTGLRKKLGLPTDKKIVIIQGAGINIQRGAEEAVESMRYVENTILLVIGGGDVLQELQMLVDKYQLADKVIFKPRMPFNELIQYTSSADLGLTLDKDTNLNYRFSLPNKLFDYIQAGLPVLASRLPEVEKIVSEYSIGTFIHSHDPKEVAQKINEILRDTATLDQWKKNGELASRELTWQRESLKFIKVFDGLL